MINPIDIVKNKSSKLKNGYNTSCQERQDPNKMKNILNKKYLNKFDKARMQNHHVIPLHDQKRRGIMHDS